MIGRPMPLFIRISICIVSPIAMLVNAVYQVFFARIYFFVLFARWWNEIANNTTQKICIMLTPLELSLLPRTGKWRVLIDYCSQVCLIIFLTGFICESAWTVHFKMSMLKYVTVKKDKITCRWIGLWCSAGKGCSPKTKGG